VKEIDISQLDPGRFEGVLSLSRPGASRTGWTRRPIGSLADACGT
jgi:hypothetical protein